MFQSSKLRVFVAMLGFAALEARGVFDRWSPDPKCLVATCRMEQQMVSSIIYCTRCHVFHDYPCLLLLKGITNKDQQQLP
jgi:hypothetical protein